MTSINKMLPRLSRSALDTTHPMTAIDRYGNKKIVQVASERPLTIKVDNQELVTLMTLGSHPELLVLGYLRNQALFKTPHEIEEITVNWEQETANVETHSKQGLSSFDTTKKTITTGCGQGTILSCTLDKLYEHRKPFRTFNRSDIYRVLKTVSSYNEIYRRAGSVHGCGLCDSQKTIIFVEDVGRHNAMDTIAGDMWLKDIKVDNLFFYTTGRLTSEIVMKAAIMGIQILISRNGTTHMGCELAEDLGVSLIARAKGHHFHAFHAEGMIFD